MNRLRSTPLPAVQLRAALASNLDALPDAELLDRFARYADHPAFEALLRRHGPMVLGVCRRTLGGSADTDDAFQATFLVFLRKAKTVRGERLGPWLYGVAWRVAQKARARAARFAAHRTEGVDMLPAADDHVPVPDWLPVLDAELSALPAKYRDALVLCELQGRSRATAAQELGLREGTLSSRLARGRDLLRKRLLKHGTLLPAGGLGALFAAAEVGRATVPVSLLAAVSELAKSGATGAVPVGAARLTDEVLKSMLLTKLRTTCCTLVALACAAAGLTAGWSPEPGASATNATEAVTAGESPKRTEDKPVVAPQPVDKTLATPKLTDREALQGLWVLDKVEAGKGVKEDEAYQLNAMVGKMKLLVVGDVWWAMEVGLLADATPKWGMLDPTKNPKWLDWYDGPNWGGKISRRFIYELTGDTLRICTLFEQSGTQRPAEFATDSDIPLAVSTFRRDKLPPPAGEKALLGSWAGKPGGVEYPGGKDKVAFTPAAEVFDGFIMLALSHVRPNLHLPGWVGGRYTVNATKNPKWIDVDLVGPMGDNGAITKLYGCYEVRDGRLKLVLGSKRATRPLEFKEAADVLLFNLGPATADEPAPRATPADTRPLPDKMEGPLNPKGLADTAAIAGHLQAWEKWTAGVTNFRAEVKLKRTNAITGNTETLSGATLCMKPHFAIQRLSNSDDSTKNDYEAYICNETAVYTYNGLAKTVTEFKRPSVLSPKAAIFSFNFFTDVKAIELQGRFAISLLKTDEHYLYLDIKPRLTKDRGEFQHLRLALYNPGPLTKDVSYLPAAIHLVKANGDKEQWWFTNPQVNVPGVEPKHFQYVEIREQGWTTTKASDAGEPAGDDFAEIKRLFAAGRFADAELLWLRRAPVWRGDDRAVGQILIATCLIELAKGEEQHKAAGRYRRVEKHLCTAVDEANRLPPTSSRAAWVRTQADLRLLQLLSVEGRLDELLTAVPKLTQKYANTVDGLVVLSLAFHAQKKKGQPDQALQTQERMRKLFDELKGKPGAFTAEGMSEFSRSYWETVWFSEK